MSAILITGASRGLGLEFVKQYAADGWDVHAVARKAEGEIAGLAKQHSNIKLHTLDVTDHAAVDALGQEMRDVALDVLINCAGIFGPEGFGGEGQNFASMDYALWRKVLEVNTLAPYKFTQTFVPHLTKSKNPRVALITSQMGSMAGMKEAGMISTAYQSSKAALNMTGITLSTELRPKGITVLLLHPGWVQTDMGGSEAPVKPTESITGMRKVIADAGMSDTASYHDYQGKQIAW
jgi:NAD(P)-dependent dehydrogenase (short-subunit alcohol dehydrogenase family)